jgi:hypothetical protein
MRESEIPETAVTPEKLMVSVTGGEVSVIADEESSTVPTQLDNVMRIGKIKISLMPSSLGKRFSLFKYIGFQGHKLKCKLFLRIHQKKKKRG